MLKDDFAQQYVIRAAPKVIARSSVVYASNDIPAGTILTTDMLELHMLAVDKIPGDAATSLAQVAGHRLRTTWEKGTILPKRSLE